jgi:hypothetical protein
MRLALIALAATLLAGCGNDTGEAGPERRSAAGEVLGGEVTDDMLPLDTVRSTSPADRSDPASAPKPDAPTQRADEEGADVAPEPQPQPEVSGGPGGRQPDMNEPPGQSAQQ